MFFGIEVEFMHERTLCIADGNCALSTCHVYRTFPRTQTVRDAFLSHADVNYICQIVLRIQQTVILSLECYFIKFIDTISLFI